MTVRLLQRLVLAAALALAAAVSAPSAAVAQEAVTQKIDYASWEKDAAAAEEALDAGRASSTALEALRARIASWRSEFDAERSANQAQVDTLKSQIAELGSPPAEGTPEAPEIAQRRHQLNELLARAQAPGLAASEAYSRADGIVRRIDKLIRERQADNLLRLLPSPANPLHWPSGVAVLTQGGQTLAAEVRQNWENPARRAELRNNLPLILICVLVAGLLMARGPDLMERLSIHLQRRTGMRARYVVATIVSLGQIVLPLAGMALLQVAMLRSGLPGQRLTALISALTPAAAAYFAGHWLASMLFPTEDHGGGARMFDRPVEARVHVRMIGLMAALEQFRIAFTTEVRPPLSQAAQAFWLTPNVLIIALFLFRLGMLLRRQMQKEKLQSAEEAQFRNRLIQIGGTLVSVVAVIAPVLALVGYVPAANALIWPTVDSLAICALVILLQRFLTDVYVIVTKSGEEGRERLIPVLTGFLLSASALPLLALAWGARPADLSEIWTRFQGGFTVGGTRISPSAVLTLLAVFALGYTATRLVQGAMRASLLPRTRLDKGAQNAAVAGLGYLGIFLSGLVAVNAAGIDLSALAIVAGALSVGIGFGLQNIVQNFISGIILLVERPISEGDVVEVAGNIGTVRTISVRSTRILTGDQTEVIVPNAQFVSGIVTNWTRDSLRGRAVVPVTVAEGSDTRKVEAILRDLVDDQPLVLIDPEPGVFLTGFGPHGINFEVRAILSDLNFKAEVVSEINHNIVQRFAAEGIELVTGRQETRLVHERLEDRPKPRPKPRPPARPARVPVGEINNDPRSDPDEREDERQ